MVIKNKFNCKNIFTIFTILVAFILLPSNIYALNGTITGTGAQNDPFLIEDIEDLKQFRNNVNNGNNYSGQFIKLVSDIDMSVDKINDVQTKWVAIGNTSSNKFSGIFDGNNKTISNMICNPGSVAGFIGYNNGTLQNLNFTNANITGSSSPANAGVAVAYNNSTGVVYNVVSTNATISLTGSATGVYGLGGIVGYSIGTIDSCANIGGSIKSTTSNDGRRIGGIVGNSKGGIVRNCYNTAPIDANSSAVGGIAGDDNVYGGGGSSVIIANCYNWGSVKGNNGIGGVSGENTGGAILKNTYSAGKITTKANGGTVTGNSTNGRMESSFGIVGGSDNSATNSKLVGYGSSTGTSKVNKNSTELQALCDKLNQWVNTENTKAGDNVYKNWYIDSVTDYPIFAPSVTITFKTGEHGQFENGVTTKTITTYAGSSWDNNWVPSVITDEGWIANGWNKTFPEKVSENATYTYQYLKDENKDQIPDVYQKKVTFKVVNGLWVFDTLSSTDTIELWLTLLGEDGKPSATGKAQLTTPTNQQPNEDYGHGSWDVIPPFEVEGNEAVTYTYTYDYLISRALITFKIENGTWSDGTTDDIEMPILLYDGKYTLNAEDVPTKMIANYGYAYGKWDVTPNTNENGITKSITYTYSYENVLSYVDVTFKIQNGTWSDGTTNDKIVEIELYDGKGTLTDDDVPTNMIAEFGFVNGKWDVTPNTNENGITKSITYTYSFEENIYGEGEEAPEEDIDGKENVIKPEETPIKPEDIVIDTNPKTSDNVGIYFISSILSLFVLMLISLKNKKMINEK